MIERVGMTPSTAGFSMPPEWGPHQACLMAWPSRTDLWGRHLRSAQRDYATVAHAIARFEPVIMVVDPGDITVARDRCGSEVEYLSLPIDDSWIRDSGPIFVRDGEGAVAAVKFGFNAWGERWHPYDDDARLPERIADHLGMRLFVAPLILEGGAVLTDGDGTVFTTEQCLLAPNRNPAMDRTAIEQTLQDYLGVTTVVWLPYGHSLDVGPAGTDGHVDGVAQVVAPGHVLLEAPGDRRAGGYGSGRANLDRLRVSRDARGRPIDVTILDPGPDARISYANHYLANGAVIVPTTGARSDGPALEFLAQVYPGREVVGVPGETLAFGGGGPHCITQQIPEGPIAVA